jgi:hypothetical protein
VTPDVIDSEAFGIGSTGNNTYTISGTNVTGSFSIFDTGGTDTLDFSGQSLNSTINLHQTLSYIGSTGSTSSSNAAIIYDSGEYYSGLIVSIYFANSIENVNAGSGNDTITCSSVSNVVNCGAGADIIVGIATGDTINAGDGNDGFSPTNTSFTLIDGGAGDDTLYLYQGYVASSSGDYTGFVDLRTFTDAQLTNIENINISIDGVATKLILTKSSINDLEGSLFDVDGDGDDDNVVYITASSVDKLYIFPNQGWEYAGSSSTYYFYTIPDSSANAQTFFAWSKSAGNILYIFNSGSPGQMESAGNTNPVDITPIVIDESNETIIDDEVNDSFTIDSFDGIENNNTDDNDIIDNPDNEDTPMDSDLPDLSFWTNDYDLGFITLPDTVVETPLVLTDALVELIDIPSESLELVFPLNGDAIHIDKVTNSTVDEINLDPLLQNDWQAVMEEYIYTSELG